jgi:hypothetical protein
LAFLEFDLDQLSTGYLRGAEGDVCCRTCRFSGPHPGRPHRRICRARGDRAREVHNLDYCYKYEHKKGVK